MMSGFEGLFTVFPRAIAGAISFFFHNKRGRLFEVRRLFKGSDYFKYCSLEVMPYIFCFIIPYNKEIIASNKLNMGYFNPNLVPSLSFNVNIQSVRA